MSSSQPVNMHPEPCHHDNREEKEEPHWYTVMKWQ